MAAIFGFSKFLRDVQSCTFGNPAKFVLEPMGTQVLKRNNFIVLDTSTIHKISTGLLVILYAVLNDKNIIQKVVVEMLHKIEKSEKILSGLKYTMYVYYLATVYVHVRNMHRVYCAFPIVCFLSRRSDFYRSIKLFFVGNGKRGKTTLLRRLRGMSEDKKVERTAGIDIESWVYPEQKKFIKDKRKPVNFLAWDFAGQVGQSDSNE